MFQTRIRKCAPFPRRRCKQTQVHKKVKKDKVKLKWTLGRRLAFGKTQKIKLTFLNPHSPRLSCVSWSPWGSLVLVKTLFVWVKSTAEFFGSAEFSYFYLSVSASLHAAALQSSAAEFITLCPSKSAITSMFFSLFALEFYTQHSGWKCWTQTQEN